MPTFWFKGCLIQLIFLLMYLNQTVETLIRCHILWSDLHLQFAVPLLGEAMHKCIKICAVFNIKQENKMSAAD